MGVAKSTIYDVVKRSEDGKTMKHQGRGKQAVEMTSMKKKVLKAICNKVGISQN